MYSWKKCSQIELTFTLLRALNEYPQESEPKIIKRMKGLVGYNTMSEKLSW